MSLSWLEDLTLFIHPAQVSLQRQGWRGASERWSATVVPASTSEAAWQPALVAAHSLLADHARSGNRLRVVVADPFVRYVVVPSSEVVVSPTARLAMARALFRHSLGDAAELLAIALDRPAFGSNGLAAGLPQDLLLALRQAAKLGKLRLHAIQPRLQVELAAARKTLDDGYVVLSDTGWLTLLGVSRGSPCLVRNHRVGGSVADELQGLLAAESSALAVRKLHVFSDQPWPQQLGDWLVDCRQPSLSGAAHA